MKRYNDTTIYAQVSIEITLVQESDAVRLLIKPALPPEPAISGAVDPLTEPEVPLSLATRARTDTTGTLVSKPAVPAVRLKIMHLSIEVEKITLKPSLHTAIENGLISGQKARYPQNLIKCFG